VSGTAAAGTVENRWTKRLAEALADSVAGGRDVRNELRITGGGAAREASCRPA